MRAGGRKAGLHPHISHPDWGNRANQMGQVHFPGTVRVEKSKQWYKSNAWVKNPAYSPCRRLFRFLQRKPLPQTSSRLRSTRSKVIGPFVGLHPCRGHPARDSRAGRPRHLRSAATCNCPAEAGLACGDPGGIMGEKDPAIVGWALAHAVSVQVVRRHHWIGQRR
jgi:hypothetical protein